MPPLSPPAGRLNEDAVIKEMVKVEVAMGDLVLVVVQSSELHFLCDTKKSCMFVFEG